MIYRLLTTSTRFIDVNEKSEWKHHLHHLLCLLCLFQSCAVFISHFSRPKQEMRNYEISYHSLTICWPLVLLTVFHKIMLKCVWPGCLQWQTHSLILRERERESALVSSASADLRLRSTHFLVTQLTRFQHDMDVTGSLGLWYVTQWLTVTPPSTMWQTCLS